MMINSSSLKKRLNLHTHVCNLPATSSSDLPRLPPNAKFYNRWKRNLQKLILVSPRHPLTCLILRSQATITSERKGHAKSPYRWMIHPCSILRFYWDMLMTIVFLYTFITVPYITSFLRIGRNSGPELWNIVYPVYILCILDIFLNFFTGVISSNGHEIFLDSALVARHYVRRYFLVDLISSVPYMWFYPTYILSAGPNSNLALLLIEFLPTLKIIRIHTVRRNIHYFSAFCDIPRIQKTIIWLAILTLMMIHWSSCISYIFPYIVMHIQHKTMESSDTYYMSEKLYNKPDWQVYLTYMHIGLSDMLGSSFKEFETFGMYDKSVRCILLLLGRGYVVYLIVRILQLLETSSQPELKYQRIMHQVKEYIDQKKLPRYLQDKLISYYEYYYHGSFFKENDISYTLSNYLNQEIAFHHNRSLLDIAIIRDLPRNILDNLMESLKPVIYLNGDVIYEADTESDCMFFITTGTVALITFSGKEICHLHDSDHFGETGLIHPNLRRTESVIALETCELLRLERHDFKRLFSLKSDLYNSLKDIVEKHMEKIKKLEEQDLEETIEK